MAIEATDTRTGEVTKRHMGCVVAIRKYTATRNCSDTMDYTDFRTIEVTEALVYFGRRVPADLKGTMWIGPSMHEYRAGEDIPPEKRLGWVDCTNTFSWRNGVVERPVVDVEWTLVIPGFIEDYEWWTAREAEILRKSEADHAAAELKRQADAKEAEANRPVKGKRMIVVSGRKVPKGTIGTVAFISGNTGGVLIKADNEWQDRKANGVWVDPRHLRARA